MKTEINKFGEEIAVIFTELADIETTIQSELKRHTELTVKLADAFNTIKSQLDKKFELPVSSDTLVSMTEAERLAVRKRFRNLGDVLEPSKVISESSKESVAEWAAQMLKGVSSRITYNKEREQFHFRYTGSDGIDQSFFFSLEPGYRLAKVNESLEKGEYTPDGMHWLSRKGLRIIENSYPIRCKI
jgi:hypothetical protein